MSAPRIVILVENPAVRAHLEELAKTLPWASPRGVCFVVADGEIQQVVAEHRAREGAVPVGVVGLNEQNVLSALGGGADDAAVLSAAADATSLTAFVDRVELRARLRAESQHLHESFAHAEKLTALGTLVAGIGHEINNPLSVLLLSIECARRYVLPIYDLTWEMARTAQRGEAISPETMTRLARMSQPRERSSGDASRIFDDIGQAGDSIASIVRDLRVFARGDQEEPPEVVSVEELIDQALRLVGRELFQHALLERDYASGLPKLVVPRNRVAQVIINILINAAHAIREVERATHRIRISARADAEFVAISISDTGPGIAPETVDRIFDPFFTTKRQEIGTGLGLSISRSIVRRLGGDLSVESVYGDGATFLCFLPVATHKTMDAVSRRKDTVIRRSSSPPAAMHSVLVVDDDERVLRSYVRLLNPLHRVLIAQDARDAIDLIESGSTPDLVLLELDLPGFDGRKLLGWLAEHRPKLYQRALVVTSAASRAQYEPFLRTYEGPVLHKPVHGDELLAEITRMLS
jgi:signal transduction histidine kinase/CheY-like chemotaxis protein